MQIPAKRGVTSCAKCQLEDDWLGQKRRGGDNRQKGAEKGDSVTPGDEAKYPPRYTSINLESVFSSRHEAAKRRIKDQFCWNVFSDQASMPNVFTTGRSQLSETLPPFLRAAVKMSQHLSFRYF